VRPAERAVDTCRLDGLAVVDYAAAAPAVTGIADDVRTLAMARVRTRADHQINGDDRAKAPVSRDLFDVAEEVVEERLRIPDVSPVANYEILAERASDPAGMVLPGHVLA
jgi:hypothetical protein